MRISDWSSDVCSSDLVERLARVDCCALSDALDRLRIKGAVTHLPQRSGAGRIAGIAVTFRVAPGDPPPGPARHLGTTAIAASDSPRILVVEQRSGIEAGCRGGSRQSAGSGKSVSARVDLGGRRIFQKQKE